MEGRFSISGRWGNPPWARVCLGTPLGRTNSAVPGWRAAGRGSSRPGSDRRLALRAVAGWRGRGPKGRAGKRREGSPEWRVCRSALVRLDPTHLPTRAPAESEAQLVPWCQGCWLLLAGPALCKRLFLQGFARWGAFCMKPQDPPEQRQQRRSQIAALQGPSPEAAEAPVSGSLCMSGCRGAHGPELRLPGALGRGAGGAVEARRRGRRRKRRRAAGTAGPGSGQCKGRATAAAPGSPCSWPRPWWSGNG